MRNNVIMLAGTILAISAVSLSGCVKDSRSQLNKTNVETPEANVAAEETASEEAAVRNSADSPMGDTMEESRVLTEEETKEYKEDYQRYIRELVENNDNNTNQALESIEAEFADLKEVTPDNYAGNKSFSQFAKDCTYLDEYMEEDTPGDQVGVLGLKYVVQVLQNNKKYKSTLEEFQDFYSDNIEELYDHCYYTGKYIIGQGKLTAGEYVLFTDNPDGSTYTVYSDASSGQAVLTGTIFYNTIISVNDGESLELGENCKAVPIEDAEYIDEEEGTMFKIGYHLEAGNVKLAVDDSPASYKVYADSRHATVLREESISGNVTISVNDGEYLELKNCHVDIE